MSWPPFPVFTDLRYMTRITPLSGLPGLPSRQVTAITGVVDAGCCQLKLRLIRFPLFFLCNISDRRSSSRLVVGAEAQDRKTKKTSKCQVSLFSSGVGLATWLGLECILRKTGGQNIGTLQVLFSGTFGQAHISAPSCSS